MPHGIPLSAPKYVALVNIGMKYKGRASLHATAAAPYNHHLPISILNISTTAWSAAAHETLLGNSYSGGLIHAFYCAFNYAPNCAFNCAGNCTFNCAYPQLRLKCECCVAKVDRPSCHGQSIGQSIEQSPPYPPAQQTTSSSYTAKTKAKATAVSGSRRYRKLLAHTRIFCPSKCAYTRSFHY